MMLAEPLAADAEVQVEGLRPWHVRSYLSPSHTSTTQQFERTSYIAYTRPPIQKKEPHLPFEKAASPCIGRVQNDEGRKKNIRLRKYHADKHQFLDRA